MINFESIGSADTPPIDYSEVTIKAPYFFIPQDGAEINVGPDKAKLTSFPKVVGIEADGVVNRRITSNTKNIRIHFQNKIQFENNQRASAIEFYLGTKNKDGSINELFLMSNGNDDTRTSKEARNIVKINTYIHNLELKGINNLLPLYIFVNFRPQFVYNKKMIIELGAFTNDTSIKLSPTITSELNLDSTQLSGTGSVVGDEISTNLSDETATVEKNGSGAPVFNLHLKQKLSEYLLTHDYLQLTESNVNGDTGMSKKFSQLKVTTSEPNPEFHLDDVSSISTVSDQNIEQWLRDKFNIRVINKDVDAQTVKYTIKNAQTGQTTDFAQQIRNLAGGQTLNLDIQARAKGCIDSAPVHVKLVKQVGYLSLAIGQNEMNFKSQQVPLVPRKIWYDETWQIMITDNRKKRNGWKLDVQTVDPDEKMNDENGPHNLNEYLYYQDDTGKSQRMMNNTILVDQDDERVSARNSVPVYYQHAVSFGNSNHTQREIYVQGKPDMWSGKYVGKILWTLEITPNTTA